MDDAIHRLKPISPMSPGSQEFEPMSSKFSLLSNFFPFLIFLVIFAVFIFFIIFIFYNQKRAKAKGEALDKEIQRLRKQIIVTSSNFIPGREIKEVIGLVRGVSKTSASTDAEFRLAEKEALVEMMEEALRLGANAILDLKVTTGSYEQQGSQWMVSKVIYTGTAVKIK